MQPNYTTSDSVTSIEDDPSLLSSTLQERRLGDPLDPSESENGLRDAFKNYAASGGDLYNSISSGEDLGAIAPLAINDIQPLSTSAQTPIPSPVLTSPPYDTIVPQFESGYSPTGQVAVGQNDAFDLIGLTQLRNDSRFSGIDGSGYTVALIDTGLDYTHPLLKGNYVAGYNFVQGTTEPTDYLRHGTHVAGIAGSTDPNIGVATDVGLIGLQVFGTGSLAFNPNIEKALQWVYTNRDKYNIAAVNISIGGGSYTLKSQVLNDILSDDVQKLEQVGIPVVTAAGNGYQSNQTQNLASPAIQSTIAVGGVWQNSDYSNYWWGQGAVDYSTGADRIMAISQRLNASNVIFAPGALINSTVPGGGLEEFGGTSMAAPMVTGAIALMQEAATQYAGRRLSVSEILDILRSSADSIYDGDDENDSVANTNTSYKRLNVYKAIETIYQRFGGSNNNDTSDKTNTDGKTDTGTSNPALDPNGTLSTATVGPSLNGQPVRVTYGEVGKDGTSSIGAKDVDMIRFTVQAAGTVTLEVIPDYINRKDFDSYLRVFNQQGNELTSDDNAGIDNFSKASLSLRAGTYYAGISGAGNRSYNPNKAGSGTNGATGTYALRLTLAPSTSGDAQYETTTLAGDVTEGDDLITGTDSGETLQGLGGNDTIWGRAGDDLLKGDAGNDTLNGEAGDDILVGGGGSDTLEGGTGKNLLRGSGGNDTLNGGSERDRLLGRRGNDVLRGGGGSNTLTGGADRDVFVLQPGGRQTISDFEVDLDQFKLEGGLTSGNLSFKDRGDRTLVSASGEVIGVFMNVTPADLAA